MGTNTTHTFATLELTPAAYNEVRAKLVEADYHHAFHEDGLIDMHGIAIAPTKRDEKPKRELETINDQLVSAQGDAILVLMPKNRMTKEQAMRQAAWLVALAGGREAFLEVLDAVEAT